MELFVDHGDKCHGGAILVLVAPRRVHEQASGSIVKNDRLYRADILEGNLEFRLICKVERRVTEQRG